ncbi:MAG: hypothetical protein IJM62_05260 [Lachnospiraceae bacterium]|nr:hypothetical protein [Lachnospiraceae bacterium]
MFGKKGLLTIALLAFLSMFAFAGCSGSSASAGFSGTMELSDTFQGQRTVEVVLGAGFTGDRLEGKESKLLEILKNAPDGVTINVNDSMSLITFTFDFRSVTGYTNAVTELIGSNFKKRTGSDICVYYNRENSSFKRGTTFVENFSAADVARWLFDRMAEEGILREDDEFTELFTDNGSVLYLNGQEVCEGTDPYRVSTVEDHYITGIDIQTEITDSGYKVDISFRGNTAKLSSMGKTLTKKLRDSVPTDGNIVSVTDDDIKTYTISFKASGVEEFTQKMNKVLSSKTSYVKLNSGAADDGGEGDGQEDPDLKAVTGITIYADASYYLDYGDDGSNITYSVLASPDYTVDSISSGFGTMGGRDYEYTDEFCIVRASTQVPDPVDISFSYSVSIRSITVATDVKNESLLERTIVFTLSKDEYRLIGEQFEKRINSHLPEDTECEKTVNDRTVDYKVVFTAESGDELGRITNSFLGGNDENVQASLTGGRDKKRNIKNITYSFTDSINFTNILGGSRITDGITYSFSYPNGFSGSFSGGGSYENASSEGSTVTCTTMNKSITVASGGSRINISGWTIMILWILSAAATLVLSLLYRKKILSFIKGKENRWIDLDIRTRRQYKRLGIYAAVLVTFIFMTARLVFGIY